MTAKSPGWPIPAALAVIIFLFAMQMRIRFGSEINHDTAWYIHVAGGLLDGKQLYVDFVEVNPPLAMWLTVPAVWLSRLLGVASTPIVYVQFFALTVFSLGFSYRYLKRLAGFEGRRPLFLMPLTALVLLFVPGADFGQREHLMVLLLLPWLLLRLAGFQGWSPQQREAALIGALAAIAICLKPHAIVAVALVEAWLLFRSRSMRQTFAAENLSAFAVAAIYAVAVVLWAGAFLSEMLHLGVEAYVPFYGRPTSVLIWLSVRAGAMLIVAAGLVALVPRDRRDLPVTLLLAGIGMQIAFVLQAKGYIYQLMPAMALAAISASAAVTLIFRKPHRAAAPFIRVMAGFMLVVVLLLGVKLQKYPYPAKELEQAIIQHRPGAKSVFIASTNVFHAFPLVVRNDLAWSSRYPAQWLIPYVSHHWKGGTLPDDPIVKAALVTTVSDLVMGKPDIVLISKRTEKTYVKDGYFDYLAFYAQDSRFAALWANYRKAGAVADFDIYVRSGG